MLARQSARRVACLRRARPAGSAALSWWSPFGGSSEPEVKRHSEHRVVPFPKDVIYNVVADVPRYKEFVPYTVESKVLEKLSEHESVAELKVGFMALSERYKSRVTLDPEQGRVSAQAEGSSVFKVLTNKWLIQDRPMDPQTSSLEFEIEFQFKHSLYNSVADMFFKKVTEAMVDAFLARCEAVRDGKAEAHAYFQRIAPPRRGLFRSTGIAAQGRLLGELTTLSHFDLNELERIKTRYDSATSSSRTGELDERTFTRFFHQLFESQGYKAEDLDRSAKLIFNALDVNNDGALNFREFVAGLSTVIKGNNEERARFWLRCFDHNADGRVDRRQLYNMVYASIEVRNALMQVGISSKPQPREQGYFEIDQDLDSLAREAVDRCFAALPPEKDSVSLQSVLSQKLF
ncbi:Calcium-binding protein NCS-1 [Hondaea fermentalgiana]|uniref:Calcium-binding protein NCS-1 n=1 Tax=Hondaea fermentalgiana TaxID=2315210 RepID=A0A2R5G3W0_9STRA|nr:Calcium-binding protein NCS-1 [Hondaea fermentalgiana]|eukprot:GBG25717.1 Calcium-binding protein NCS-1 [Hondaea fermentalgiana]